MLHHLITTYSMLRRDNHMPLAERVQPQPEPFPSNDNSNEFAKFNEAFMTGAEHEVETEEALWGDGPDPEKATILVSSHTAQQQRDATHN
jgi:hypothetical protein